MMLERHNNSMVAQVIKADRGGERRRAHELPSAQELQARLRRVSILARCAHGGRHRAELQPRINFFGGGGSEPGSGCPIPTISSSPVIPASARAVRSSTTSRSGRARSLPSRAARPSSAMGSTSVRARSSSGASPLGAVRGSAPEPWPRGTSRRARWSSVRTGSLEARMIPIIGICLTSVECINTFRPLGGFHRDARTSAPMGTILL